MVENVTAQELEPFVKNLNRVSHLQIIALFPIPIPMINWWKIFVFSKTFNFLYKTKKSNLLSSLQSECNPIILGICHLFYRIFVGLSVLFYALYPPTYTVNKLWCSGTDTVIDILKVPLVTILYITLRMSCLDCMKN